MSPVRQILEYEFGRWADVLLWAWRPIGFALVAYGRGSPQHEQAEQLSQLRLAHVQEGLGL